VRKFTINADAVRITDSGALIFVVKDKIDFVNKITSTPDASRRPGQVQGLQEIINGGRLALDRHGS
jgi:hypothetical protein